jgi:hypothetical protein
MEPLLDAIIERLASAEGEQFETADGRPWSPL